MSKTAKIPARKGASRMADVSPDILTALEQGKLEAVTLTENLAIQQKKLLQAVFPDLGDQALSQAGELEKLGIVQKMTCISALLLERYGPEAIEYCQQHPSDTVRGWACFMIAAVPESTLKARILAIHPLADDAHFGVREWAWLAVRPRLAANLEASIAHLTDWTSHTSERIRRFACEALRPRGVWCTHIATLKKNPALCLPILEPLRADPAIYVQNSVGNWLNDAGKSQPDWVQQLCKRWLQESPVPATQKICTRATRNLK